MLARGTGPCLIHGHPDSPLENITLENIRLAVTSDPGSPLQKTVDAVVVDHASNFRMKDVEIVWEAPESDQWRSALAVENVRGLTLDGVSARQAPGAADAPAIALQRIDGGLVRGCRAQAGTGTFLQVSDSRDVALDGNDTRAARVPLEVDGDVANCAIL